MTHRAHSKKAPPAFASAFVYEASTSYTFSFWPLFETVSSLP